MSVDILQEKIRKLKNPTLVELMPEEDLLPPQLRREEVSFASSWGQYCRELLAGLKGIVPGIRVGFGAYALLGGTGLDVLADILKTAHEMGFYVLLDGPELLSPAMAERTARALMGEGTNFYCDGLVISSYCGSDIWKPFLPYCHNAGKDLFVVARTANKSAPELQDLLTGSRLVHGAVADRVSRCAGDMIGKSGYSRVGLMAGASGADSLKNLREKYQNLFLLLDGYDYPNSNAKNCSFAFDKFGYGAAACVGSIVGAWRDGDGDDYVEQAIAQAQRVKKNLTRYVTIL